VLILSGSIGAGHDSLAEACSGALARRGHQAETLDCMRLMGRIRGRLGELVFRSLFRVPGLYDAFHFSQLRTGGRLARAAKEAATQRLVAPLREKVQAWRPDLILSVFATGGGPAARLKSELPAMASVVFNTDACTHYMWVHEGTDLYLVTSELSAQSVRRHQPCAEVAVVPAPVRPSFYCPPTKEEARAALGVPADARCVLLMSGAWGLGPVGSVASGLARDGAHVLAVAGTNRRLARRLEEVKERAPGVTVFGFTDRIPELMSASDLVITSSGDTCAEARVVGRPLLLLDVVPGHGRENLLHELELGGAFECSAEPASVVEAAKAVLARGTRIVAPAPFPAAWEEELLSALARFGIGRGEP
jgi:processive 1,2-diacylglycerol beta-glucosyltransferase